MSSALSLKKRLLIIIAIVVLLLLAFISFCAMMADIISNQADKAEQRWQTQTEISPQEWYTARADLRIALKLSPKNPDYLQSLGRLYYHQIFVTGDPPIEPFEEGLEYYRESIAMRPYWPYAWAEFALLKSVAGELDAEFKQAIINAEKYGPWEKQVLVSLLMTYFSFWPQLESELQQRSLDLLDRIKDYDEEIERMGLSLALSSPAKSSVCEQYMDYLESHQLANACVQAP